MPYSQPPLSTLISQGSADLAADLPGTDPLLPLSNLGILTMVAAAFIKGLYGYADYIAQQSNPFTATGEAFTAWAALKGVFQKPPSPAVLSAQFTAATGATLPAATPVSRGDNTGYTVAVDAHESGGLITAQIQAVMAGSAANSADGVALVLGHGVANVSSTGAVTATVTPGVDLESFTAFKARGLAQFAAPPQGGADGDYPEWAGQVPGVTRAWVNPGGMGAGTVVVFFMMDIAEAAYGGFPQGANGVAAAETRAAPATGDQLVVANWIFPLRPATAEVYACAPGANTVTLTIKLPGASAALKAAMQAAAAQIALANGSVGGCVAPSGQTAGSLNLSDIEAALAAVNGSAGFVVTAVACSNGSVTPGSDGNIASTAGYLPVIGPITWT